MNTNATCTCNCKKCRKIIKTLKNPKKQPLTISTMNTAIIYWLYSGIKNMISIQQPLFTMWLFKNSTTKILKMVNRLSKGILNEFPLGIFLYVPFERLHLLVVIKKKKKTLHWLHNAKHTWRWTCHLLKFVHHILTITNNQNTTTCI